MIKVSKTQSREKLKEEYRTYLSRQRGLAESTVYRNCSFVDRFLDFKFKDCPDDLSKITAVDKAESLYHLTGDLQLRDKTLASTMRNFFRFLFLSERIEIHLALGITCIAQTYSRRIPYHLTPGQVDELVEAIKKFPAFPYKKRNYAMALLMARLGFRPQEVIAIQLEDIDWRNGGQ